MSETLRKDEQHLDEMTAMLYAERMLDRESAQQVSLHTQTCSRCTAMLRALDRESRLLTRSLLEDDEPLPARIAEFHAKVQRSLTWIWGLVFGLGVLGVYALYTGYVEPLEKSFEEAGFGGTSLFSLLFFQGAFWKGWPAILSFIELVALLSLGIGGVIVFRKYMRRSSAMAVLFTTLALLLGLPGGAFAIEHRKGDVVEVKKDEVLKQDLAATGGRVQIDGTVDGDTYLFGQQITVNGHVTGDVVVFAESARINGTVDGNVRAFVNNITITGTVAKNVTYFCQTVNLDSTSKVGWSVMGMNQTVSLDGKIGRDVWAAFQQATLSGTVDGNMSVQGESLNITGTAQVGGPIRFKGAKPATVSSEAKLASPVEYTHLEKQRDERGAGFYIWRLVWTGSFILFGLVLISVMPKFSQEVVESARNLGASAGLGVLVLFAVPIAAVIACITIIGFLVGFSSILLWLVVLIAAEVVVGAVVGEWIMGRTVEFWPLIARMAVGILVVRIVTTLPFIGGWAKFAVILWGMGAISLALYRRLQPVLAPSIPPVPMGPAPGAPMGTSLPPNTVVG